MSELLPCPFCGSKNIDAKGWASTDRDGPACDDCGGTADTIELWNSRPAQCAPWPKEIRSFVNEVAGVWDAFELGLRQEISNTNYVCVREKLTAVETLLSGPAVTSTDGGGK